MDKINLTKETFIINNRNNISSEIRKYREKKGFSQEQLAALMGISRTTISKIENGKFAISVDYLAKLSWHLDFDIKISEKEIQINEIQS
jgi:transcriptional regulator with XRE-family HTH domain